MFSRIKGRAWGVPIALCLGLVVPAVASAPPAQAATFSVSLSQTMVDARPQRLALTPSGCGAWNLFVPSTMYMTITYPWWAAPEGSSSASTTTFTTLCSPGMANLRVLANTTGFDRSGKITVTNGGQTYTVVLSQSKATSGQLTMASFGDSYVAGSGTSVPKGSYSPTWLPIANYDKMITVPWAIGQIIPASRRNALAWPVQLATMTGLNLPTPNFRAVNGAVSANLTTVVQSDYVTQTQFADFTDAQAAAVDVIAMSIGGNDAKFDDFVRSCAFGKCDRTYVDGAVARLSNLADTYQRMLARFPNATIYVSGYPDGVPPAKGGVLDVNVMGLYYELLTGAPSYNITAMRDFLTKVNTTVRQQVAAANDPRLRYVEVTAADFPGYMNRFGGSYYVPVLIGGLYNAFIDKTTPEVKLLKDMAHPNKEGAQAWAAAVAQAVKGTKSTSYGTKAIVTTAAGAWSKGGDMCSAFAMTNAKIRALHDSAIPGACPTSAVYTSGVNQRQDFEGGRSIVLPPTGVPSLI